MGSRDPGSLEEGRNTRRRLGMDKGPDDENARSAVLLRFPCEQCLPGMHAWLKKTLAPTDQLERVHCKRGTESARLPYLVNGPFCYATSIIPVRQSRSPELREIGRPGKVPATKVRENFPEHDTEDTRCSNR